MSEYCPNCGLSDGDHSATCQNRPYVVGESSALIADFDRKAQKQIKFDALVLIDHHIAAVKRLVTWCLGMLIVICLGVGAILGLLV